jgi:hypothetical protein
MRTLLFRAVPRAASEPETFATVLERGLGQISKHVDPVRLRKGKRRRASLTCQQ